MRTARSIRAVASVRSLSASIGSHETQGAGLAPHRARPRAASGTSGRGFWFTALASRGARDRDVPRVLARVARWPALGRQPARHAAGASVGGGSLENLVRSGRDPAVLPGRPLGLLGLSSSLG